MTRCVKGELGSEAFLMGDLICKHVLGFDGMLSKGLFDLCDQKVEKILKM